MTEHPTPRRTRRVVAAGSVGALVLAGGILTAYTVVGGPDPRPAPPTPTPTEERTYPGLPDGLDALQLRRLDELRAFAAWLDAADARGFVGEVGWPDDPRWNHLASAWLTTAADAGIPSAVWAAGGGWPSEYPLTVYGSTDRDRGLDTAHGQADVLERYPAPGVNLAGLEFGTENGFSSASPGALGVEYVAEPAASYAYLADRGVRTVRLPFRWERLQPVRSGELDPAYLRLLEEQLDAADAAGVRVVLDLHNYGAYTTADGPDPLDGTDTAALVDVWSRLDAALGDHPAIAAYGLMNEPHSLAGDIASGAALWERISQDAVTALRAEGVDAELYVPGYDWSSLARWADTHPEPWIDDPLDRFRYEAHHYWDADGSGKYLSGYADELAAISG